MKYFIRVSQGYFSSNKLEKEIKEAFTPLNNTLLVKKHLPTLIEEVRDKMIQLNEKHPRCKPKEFAMWTGMGVESFSISEVISFHAYEVQNEA